MEVVIVISKQVILLQADKAQSLCLDLAVDIDQNLLKELSHLQYVVALSHHDVVAVVLQLCEFSATLSSSSPGHQMDAVAICSIWEHYGILECIIRCMQLTDAPSRSLRTMSLGSVGSLSIRMATSGADWVL